MIRKPAGPPMTAERAAELAAVKDAVFRRVGAEFGAAQAARFLFLPTELLGPAVRRARGRTGIALGPSLTARANALAMAGLARVMRRRPRSSADRWIILGATAWCLATPALSVLSEQAVVQRDRSPLWGYGVQGVVTIPVSLGLAAGVITVGRAARDEHRRNPVAPE